MTIDLSGAPASGGQAFGRILGGALLFIVSSLVVLACIVGFIAAFFVPTLWDWIDLIGDGLLIVGAIALGLAVVGFEIMRRGRKKRAGDAAAIGLATVGDLLENAGLADSETIDTSTPTNRRVPPPETHL